MEREFGLKELVVRVSLRALMDGSSYIVHLRPATKDEFRDRTHCVGKGGVAALHASNGEGMVFADDIVRALLAIRRQVAACEVVAGQTLVAGDPSALENREREAWEPTHVDLVGSQGP